MSRDGRQFALQIPIDNLPIFDAGWLIPADSKTLVNSPHCLNGAEAGLDCKCPLVQQSGQVKRAERHMGGASRGEYTETLREVAMDKPRHPQVIRPWKTQQTQKGRWSARPTMEPPRESGKKHFTPKRG